MRRSSLRRARPRTRARRATPRCTRPRRATQWHFGMKAHIGVDAESGLVHSVIGTTANVSDITQAGALLHGEETMAFGDAGYRGVDKREEAQRPAVARRDAAGQAQRSWTSIVHGRGCSSKPNKSRPATRRSSSACSGWPISSSPSGNCSGSSPEVRLECAKRPRKRRETRPRRTVRRCRSPSGRHRAIASSQIGQRCS